MHPWYISVPYGTGMEARQNTEITERMIALPINYYCKQEYEISHQPNLWLLAGEIRTELNRTESSRMRTRIQ